MPGDAVYVSGYGLLPPESGPALGDWAASLPSGVLLFVDPGPLVAQIPYVLLDTVLARCAAASVLVRAGADGCYVAEFGSAYAVHVRAPRPPTRSPGTAPPPRRTVPSSTRGWRPAEYGTV